MERTTRGAVAAATAAVLLLGGAGSLAFWSDQQAAGTGSVTTGHLHLLTVGGDSGAWTDVTDGGNAPITDIATFVLVPGDTIRFTRTFEVDVAGDNLTADLDASLPALGGDLAGWVDLTAVVAGTAVPGIVTAADDGAVVTATVDVAFDPATPGKIVNGGVNAGDDDVVDLTALTIDLVQTQGSAGGN